MTVNPRNGSIAHRMSLIEVGEVYLHRVPAGTSPSATMAHLRSYSGRLGIGIHQSLIVGVDMEEKTVANIIKVTRTS